MSGGVDHDRGLPAEGEVGIVDGVVVSRVVGSEGSVGPVDADRRGVRGRCRGRDRGGAVVRGRRRTPCARARVLPTAGTPGRGGRHRRRRAASSTTRRRRTSTRRWRRSNGSSDAVLIAGGRAKGVDLSPLAEAASNLSAVVAIGEAAPEVLALFDGIVPATGADSIEAATARRSTSPEPTAVRCCSRRPVPAGISSPTTPSAAIGSRPRRVRCRRWPRVGEREAARAKRAPAKRAPVKRAPAKRAPT